MTDLIMTVLAVIKLGAKVLQNLIFTFICNYIICSNYNLLYLHVVLSSYSMYSCLLG